MEKDKKHVVVVGAGLIGIATAYYLSLVKNIKVTIIDKSNNVASQTSYANAGRFCPQTLLNGPPASPKGISIAIQAMFPSIHSFWNKNKSSTSKADNPQVQKSTVTPSLLYWGFWYLRNCTHDKYLENFQAHQQLSLLAMEQMKKLCASIPSLYSEMEGVNGNIWVYNTAADCSTALNKYKDSILLGSQLGGVPLDWISQSDLLPAAIDVTKMHPSLSQWQHAGGDDDAGLTDRTLYCHRDFTADARKFCLALLRSARRQGDVEVLLNESVVEWVTWENRVVAVRTASGKKIDTDSVVVCCGLATNDVIRSLRSSMFALPLPLEGMKGYTLDLYGVKKVPQVCITDYGSGKLNFQLTPFKHDRARVTGFAHFDSTPTISVEEMSRCRDAMLMHLNSLLPDVTFESTGELWMGIRPMSPDNMPMIGHLQDTPINVFLNCGHGSYGWTTAAASALLATSLVVGDREKGITTDHPEIRSALVSALSPNRFQFQTPLESISK